MFQLIHWRAVFDLFHSTQLDDFSNYIKLDCGLIPTRCKIYSKCLGFFFFFFFEDVFITWLCPFSKVSSLISNQDFIRDKSKFFVFIVAIKGGGRRAKESHATEENFMNSVNGNDALYRFVFMRNLNTHLRNNVHIFQLNLDVLTSFVQSYSPIYLGFFIRGAPPATLVSIIRSLR